jgi:hypothetical protein
MTADYINSESALALRKLREGAEEVGGGAEENVAHGRKLEQLAAAAAQLLED